jgi:non-homologous end joining protein Ku
MRATSKDDLVITTKDDGLGHEVPLLHFPVDLVKATGSVDVKYDGAAPSGGEYETRYVDTATGETFEYAERQQGVRLGEAFKPIDPEAIKAIDEATTLVDMRVETAMPYESVPFERATGMYYLQVPPKSGAHKVYRLIYLALLPQKGKTKADKQRLALRVKFSIRKRQKIGVIYADPERECLVLNTLTFAAELREPDEAVLAHKAAQVEQPQVEKARQVLVGLIDKDTTEPEDDAIELKRELVEQAAAGEAIEVPVTPTAEAVDSDNLTELLEASLA